MNEPRTFKLTKIPIRIGIFENVDLSRSLEMDRSKLCKLQEILDICVTCTLNAEPQQSNDEIFYSKCFFSEFNSPVVEGGICIQRGTYQIKCTIAIWGLGFNSTFRSYLGR